MERSRGREEGTEAGGGVGWYKYEGRAKGEIMKMGFFHSFVVDFILSFFHVDKVAFTFFGGEGRVRRYSVNSAEYDTRVF